MVAVAAGAEHSLALTAAGEVYSWGSTSGGRLGHGDPAWLTWGGRAQAVPRLLRSLAGVQVVGLTAGHMHSGMHSNPALGVLLCTCIGHSGVFVPEKHWSGRLASVLHPALKSSICDVEAGGAVSHCSAQRHWCDGYSSGRHGVECCGVCSGCVDADGFAYTWGSGRFWQLGHGSDRDLNQPKRVFPLATVSRLPYFAAVTLFSVGVPLTSVSASSSATHAIM